MGNSTTKHHIERIVKRTVSFVFLWLLCSVAKAQIPSASFSADSTSGCAPLTVHFTNTSLQATSYFWDFGNGNTSTLPNPQTVYLTSGSFTVKLVAYNSNSGQADTLRIVNYITTVAFPTANFTANVTSGCSPLAVTFTNTSVSATSYVWDFGDGYSSNLANPTHTYTTSGLYTVKLIAFTAYGCSNVLTKPSYIQVLGKPSASITATPTTTCNANEVIQFNCPATGIASYVWNFGQPSSGAANTSTLQNSTHVYGAQGTFSVSLIVTGTNGCIDTVSMPNLINIGNALTPTFTWNTSAGCSPFSVIFTAPPVTNATSYSWNFGDPSSGPSNTSNIQKPTHIYANPGNYSVSLFVTTSSGCNGGTTLTNIITVDQQPVPLFTASPTSGCAPATIHFNNNSTLSATYSWDFGDGTNSTVTSPNHTYTTPGTYSVTLHAFSVNGCEEVLTRTNYITINGSHADFSFFPTKGCAPLNVNFNSGASTNAVSWKWNFGDPSSGAANTSILQNPSHTYNNLGTYSITLITTSATGCKDTVVKGQVLVAPSSVTYVVPDTIKGCQPLPVSFSNPLAGSSIWHWDFGVPFLTNDTSNASNPVFTYDSVGIYTISLNAYMYGNNGAGCTQSFSPAAVVQVFPLILSPIAYVQATPCAPYLIHFSDTTADVVSWSWNFGDGSPVDTNQFPSHVYAQPGTYHVSLSIVTIMGCMTSLGTNITLGKTNPIVASAHGTCHDTPINFSLSSPGFTNINWTFGDGVGTSTSPNPTYTYNQPGTFVVTLTCKGNDNCNYTFRDTIVTQNPQPSFYISGPASSCGTFTAHFINTSTGATSYFWDYDDPTSSNPSSTAVNPSRKFSTMRGYDITLTASTQYCSRSITVPHAINVFRAAPSFTYTQNQLCFPITVQFTDLTGPHPAMQWLWNFYDGTTDSVKNPVHTFYDKPNVDSISLWVKDTNGCTATKKIRGIKYKEARFSLSATAGCRPLNICFTDSSDTTVVSRQWDFGDGATSTAVNPCHTYSVDGVYTVTLITTFSSGCRDTLVKQNIVTVSSPVSDFSSPVLSFCAPAVASFNNLSTGATSYLWDFGDGSTSVATSPTHVYNLPGDYTVKLIAYFGTCADTMTKVNYLHVPGTNAYFNLTSLQSCQGTNVQFVDSSIGANFWMWNFGDGDSSSSQNPLHFYADTGNYIVSLITFDSIGCTSHFIFPNPISVIPAPVAIAATNDTVGCNPFTATFSHTSQSFTSFKWLFGDATTSALANPSHTYNTAGVYQAQLVAYNSFGCTDTFALPLINVHQVPDARFTTTPASGCTPLNVSFNNTSLLLSNPSYNWDFGNTQTSTLATPQTTYTSGGTFNITLIVTNDGLCSDTVSHSVNAILSPTAIGSTNDTLGCSPYTSTFSNASIGANSYLWKFGDNTTSTLATPTHTYVNSGVYTVTLIVTNAAGCKDTLVLTKTVRVMQTPTATFTSSVNAGCTPLAVSFTNTSIDTINATYAWNFGNTLTASTINASTVYSDSLLYTVSLITTNSNGCADTATKTVNVHLSPTAIAFTNDTVGCNPHASVFTNQSVYATSYNWNFGDNTTHSTAFQPTHSYIASGNYIVTMIATNAFGCKDTIVFPYAVQVNQTPNATFSTSTVTGCSPLSVNFTSTSTQLSNAAYNWSFGNTLTSTTQNPSTVYADSGSFTATLIVTNDNGCADTATKSITVLLTPKAQASTADTVGCSPFTSTFVNTSTGATSYLWNFGDNTTSTQPNPSHTYQNGGSYTVKLIAYNANGCSDTTVFNYPIHVLQSPNASFTSTVNTGCSPLAVSFTNTSIDTSNAAYAWNFGNTLSASTLNASTVYTDSSVYNVSMIVTNSTGCKDTATKNITVRLAPTALASTADTIGCSPFTATFANNSVYATSYDWNFGDNTGHSTAATPSHVYHNAGSYTVTLIATNAFGCKDTIVLPYSIQVNQTPVAAFTPSVNSGCTQLGVNFTNSSTNLIGETYNWNFGNAITSTLSNPSVAYTDSGNFNVSLIVTNANGCTDTANHVINVHLTPTAIASTADTIGCSPFNVTFANNSIYATSYDWNFGDNTAHSTVATPSHVYQNAGSYTVTLIATNAFGCKDTIVLPYSIQVKQTPTAAFTTSVNSGCTTLGVNFTNSSTNLVGETYNWNFGNAITSTLSNPSVAYTDSGNFNVSLIVTNANGCSDTANHAINVHLTPTAIASTADTIGCSPFTTTFANNSVYVTSYDWNFGDNTAHSTAATPSHVYQNAGTYTVTLIVSNVFGCKDTIVLPYSIQVNQTPTAAFTPSVNSGCTTLEVNFTNASTSLIGETYSWNFGNAITSALSNPSVTYTDSGNFNVSLIVTNANGCTDTANHVINVHLTPTAIASTADTIGCSPFNVTFANNSIYATSYDWNFGDNSAHSTAATPSHVYQNAGTYTVTLIVSNAFGCKDTIVLPYQIQVKQTPNAGFTSSVSTGCTPLSVNFTNTSTNLINETYNWNFGNGSTFNAANPSISYPDSGVFNVSLVVTNANGCSDTANHIMNVHLTPTAIAATTDTVGCTPFTTVFTNASNYATTYNWNFGDNTTHSTAAAPSHIYQVAGTYTVTLIVGNAFGCKDTLVLPYSIHVNQTPTAAFTPSSILGCTPLTVNFSNGSTQLITPNYNWNFGNGTQSTLDSPSVTYADSGLFHVTLITSNNNGCKDTATTNIRVNISPTASGFTNDTTGCSPYTVSFTSNTTNATNIVWHFGNGQTATGNNVQYTYANAGLYQPFIIATNAYGCSDTFYLAKKVRVRQTPTAAFTVNQTAACSGFNYAFSNLSTDTINPAYVWTIGGFSTTSSNLSIPLLNPGFYTVSLSVINNNGCGDTLVKPNYIQVYDTLPPPQDPIYSVSVISNSEVKIKWANSSVLDLGSYKLWRLDPASSNYVNVYTDNNPVNSSMNPESEYTEQGLNTLVNTYTYKLQTLDRCAKTLPVSVLHPHTTVNINAQKNGSNIDVSWTPYGGCPVATYEISRVEVSNGSSALIAVVPGTQLFYKDTTLMCPVDYSYRVQATDLCGLPYTSFSDTAIGTPGYLLADQEAIIVRSTVVNNEFVLTEWSEPQLHPERVIQYNIYRSTDTTGTQYSFLTSVGAGITSYEDYNVDVNGQNYYYKLEAVSDCNLSGKQSENSSSILLQSKWEYAASKLWWTRYDKWDTGVERYEIEKYNWITRQWEKVKTVPGNATQTEVDE